MRAADLPVRPARRGQAHQRGRELCNLTGFKLLHNHLLVDLVTTIFPHESDSYFRLVRQIRQDVLVEAARATEDLVLTAVYRGTADQTAAVAEHIRPVLASNGMVLFVQLTCERGEWLRRLQTESRRAQRKLTDPNVVLEMLAQYDLFATLPFEPTLCIDTTRRQPTDIAREIVGKYPTLVPPSEV